MSEWTKVTISIEDEQVRLVSVDGECLCSCIHDHVCVPCWMRECVPESNLEDFEGLIKEGETKQLLTKYVDTSSDGPEGWDYNGHVKFKEVDDK